MPLLNREGGTGLLSKSKAHGVYSRGLWGNLQIGVVVGPFSHWALLPPTSRLIEHRAGNLRGCSPYFLREGINKLSVPGVGATAKLEKIEKDIGRESPHGESVLKAAQHERMDQ
jgi:hypothetical protein